jgi:hypothetical protein
VATAIVAHLRARHQGCASTARANPPLTPSRRAPRSAS